MPPLNNLRQQYRNQSLDDTNALACKTYHYYLVTVDKNRVVLAYGDLPFFLKYDLEKNFWTAIKYDPHSGYQGSLRYSAICKVASGFADSDLLIITGGVHNETLEPVNDAYRVNAAVSPSNITQIASMQ